MNKFCLRTLSVVAFTSVAFAQIGGFTKPTGTVNGEPFKPEKPMSFEVATVKLAEDIQKQAMSGNMHVGLNVDGARADIGGMSLQDLITIAYKVKPHQIVGPDWMPVQRYDIMGKMPQGATKDDIATLMQPLLKERFGLQFHVEKREQSVYALVVAKGGHKMKDAPPDPVAPPEGSEAAKAPGKDEKGATTMNVGGQKMTVKQTGDGNATMSMNTGTNGNMKMTMENGHMHMAMDKADMPTLTAILSRFLDKPVMDQTELTGFYQVAIDLTMEDLMNVARQQGMQIPGGAPGGAASSSRPAETIADPSGSSLFSAIAQMGLKLETKKMLVPVIVVDHVEKTPTEN
jgi:uncharacterized protein (TIGR03435 family)